MLFFERKKKLGIIKNSTERHMCNLFMKAHQFVYRSYNTPSYTRQVEKLHSITLFVYSKKMCGCYSDSVGYIKIIQHKLRAHNLYITNKPIKFKPSHFIRKQRRTKHNTRKYISYTTIQWINLKKKTLFKKQYLIVIHPPE